VPDIAGHPGDEYDPERARGVVKGDALGQALFIAELFGIAA